jgi:hypothetical protein
MTPIVQAETIATAGFWESPLAGVVVGALLSAFSTFVLWHLSRRSDGHKEARTIRREAGIESIRCAWRLRDACNELIVANAVAFEHKESREQKTERERRWQVWQDASEAMGQQLFLARALGTPQVWVPLKYVSDLERLYMPEHHMPHKPEDDASAFQEQMDQAIEFLADAVREDARVMDGVRQETLQQRLRNRWASRRSRGGDVATALEQD